MLAPLDVSRRGSRAGLAWTLLFRVIYPLLGLGWCASHVGAIVSCADILKIGSELFLVRVLFVIFQQYDFVLDLTDWHRLFCVFYLFHGKE